jgi:hypothetical protein
LNPIRLGDEILDDQKNDKGENEGLDDFEETPEGALAHKSGSIGMERGRRPRLDFGPRQS